MKIKKRKKNAAIYTALVFCLTATLSTVTGCGSRSDSDFKGKMPPAVSGGAADMGNRPEKPADFDPEKKPDGAPDLPVDFDPDKKPEGAPDMPADFDPNNLPDGVTPPDNPEGSSE